MDFDKVRDTVKWPGNDPVDRLKHVNEIYGTDGSISPGDHAITATHGLYAAGVWTGLTYGDLQELEKTITLGATAERVKIVNYVRLLSREMVDQSSGMGIGAAVGQFLNQIADKINSYQDC